ncbi:MAG: hypothetical protein M3Q10_16670, partial [Chloroflexota bacterium]|nr:hypothetical protein [Chloroflexota bacterium]
MEPVSFALLPMTAQISPECGRAARRAIWLARLERWTAWPLNALALALVPILLAPSLLSLSDDTQALLLGLDYLI